MMSEIVDKSRATYICNMTFDDFRPIAKASRQNSDVKALYTKTMRWATQHSIGNKVTFTYSRKNGSDCGRMFSNGIAGIPRDIRGFCCMLQEEQAVSTMTDLDMDNCHPVILEWVCVKNGILCDYLSAFVRSRKEKVQEMMLATGLAKDDVKGLFLASVNSQAEQICPNKTTFFENFDRECKQIQASVFNLTEYRFLRPRAEASAQEKLDERKAALRKERRTCSKLTANVMGSFVNLVLCTWEDRFLGKACAVVTSLGFTVCSLNYDGLMIAGDHYPIENVPQSSVRDKKICPALQQVLKSTYDIDIGWSMKRHSTSLTYSNDGIRLPYPRYAEPWLKQVCRVGAEFAITLSDGTVEFEAKRTLLDRLCGEAAKCICVYDGAPSWHTAEFNSTFVKDPRMRSFEKADVYPRDCPPNVYNLWRPMPCDVWDACEANPQSDHVKVFRRLTSVLADNNTEVQLFIELFIAHMLKYPEIKPGAWLVLMSEEGAGKGTLICILRQLMGIDKVREIENAGNTLFGSFNSILLDAFLLVLDETSTKDMFSGKEQLKNLITAPEVMVNQKNVKAKPVQSYARFILTMQPRAVPTKKGDRRGVISCCSDELIGDTAFYDDIYARMETNEFRRDIHAYLMQLDPPKVFRIDNLPQTDVQREIQSANADPFETWVKDVATRWQTPTREEDELRDIKGVRCAFNRKPEFTLQALHSDFRSFAELNHMTRLVEKMTYMTFCSRFSYCRWRKHITTTRHKIKSVLYQCRQWDIDRIAADFTVDSKTESDKKREREEEQKIESKKNKSQIVNSMLRRDTVDIS